MHSEILLKLTKMKATRRFRYDMDILHLVVRMNHSGLSQSIFGPMCPWVDPLDVHDWWAGSTCRPALIEAPTGSCPTNKTARRGFMGCDPRVLKTSGFTVGKSGSLINIQKRCFPLKACPTFL